jgi:predicted adenine nucleotide alpha hydrolase (AANH) superfamily ATPase
MSHYLPSLLTAAIQYESCFLGYAHQDKALAQRLYKDLQDEGVRCWFAPHDLRPGSYYHRGIEEAIYLQEKLLLLLSEDAIQSRWVETEVLAALDKERHQGCEMLFPVRLDETVMQTSQAWRPNCVGAATSEISPAGRTRQSTNNALQNCSATSK